MKSTSDNQLSGAKTPTVVEVILPEFSPAEQQRHAKMDAAADRQIAAYERRCKRARREG